MAEAEERSTWPVFLIGCHRSGTTLARYLLDSHPHLACPPESKFIAGLQEFVEYPQAWAGLATLGVSSGQIYAGLRTLICTFLGGYAQGQRKRRWVDKTPNYYRILPFLDNVFEAHVLYMFLIRHPLDTINSMNAHFGSPLDAHDDPEIYRFVQSYGRGLFTWARYWNEVNGCLAQFAQAFPGRCHIFRYEELVRSPEETLQSALAFIGETYPPDLIHKAFSGSHTVGYMDKKIAITTGITASRVDKWKRWPASQVDSLWNVVSETAVALGYSAPGRQTIAGPTIRSGAL